MNPGESPFQCTQRPLIEYCQVRSQAATLNNAFKNRKRFSLMSLPISTPRARLKTFRPSRYRVSRSRWT